eukprot:657672-Hanusia_phi.AAC.2
MNINSVPSIWNWFLINFPHVLVVSMAPILRAVMGRAVERAKMLGSPLVVPAHAQLRNSGYSFMPAMGMAGHSKWHNIRHKKGAEDAKKSILYTRIS